MILLACILHYAFIVIGVVLVLVVIGYGPVMAGVWGLDSRRDGGSFWAGVVELLDATGLAFCVLISFVSLAIALFVGGCNVYDWATAVCCQGGQ